MANTPRKSAKNGLIKDALESGSSPDSGDIPDKLYFKIGEVSQITGVEPHVLRYWESEFKVIKPQRATSKQRLYRRVDVEHILLIKKLLYLDGFTVPGARKHLAAGRKAEKKPARSAPAAERAPAQTSDGLMLQELKAELHALKKMLER